MHSLAALPLYLELHTADTGVHKGTSTHTTIDAIDKISKSKTEKELFWRNVGSLFFLLWRRIWLPASPAKN